MIIWLCLRFDGLRSTETKKSIDWWLTCVCLEMQKFVSVDERLFFLKNIPPTSLFAFLLAAKPIMRYQVFFRMFFFFSRGSQLSLIGDRQSLAPSYYW